MHYSKPFTKLFSSIITSSIWNENDKVRVVWITMLALSDANGFVCASVGGLAHAARVEKEECEAALGCLLSPDDDSRSKEFDGQRIGIVDGGYLILNYKKYRDLGRKIDRDEYLADKQWESRQKKKLASTNVNTTSTRVNKPSTNSSASASASMSDSDWIDSLSTDSTYNGIDIKREHGKMVRWCEVNRKKPSRRRFIRWINGAERPMSKATAVDYKRNYPPPPKELSDEEFEAQRKIALEECARAKATLNNK